jgi:tetratricopeptide (TPR) repeat protein
MADTYDVFVSYARADGEQVRRLAENLYQSGLEVFFDEWEVGPGDVLVHQLDRGLMSAKNGLVVVTPTALSRPWVLEEYAAMITRAVQGGFRVVPVLLVDAELPPLLASRVWVDLRQADGPVYGRELARLVAMLKGGKSGPPPRTGALLPRAGSGFRKEGRMVRRLRITPEEVVLSNDGEVEARHPHRGLGGTAAPLLYEWRRAVFRRRAEDAVPVRSSGLAHGLQESALNQLHLDLGAALSRTFLKGAAGGALRGVVEQATTLGVPLALALEVADEMSDLPWELLRLPEPEGMVGPPLALHPNVELYRTVPDLGTATAIAVPRPLRVLVAIGSPEEQNPRGELLDMEAELRRILDAVELARRHSRAHIRILNRGTMRAIREALQEERYHVLHVSCHAAPGALILEDDQGKEDRVDAERFCREALVPGRGVPLVVLAGCATAFPPPPEQRDPGEAGARRADQPGKRPPDEVAEVEEGAAGERVGERVLPCLARQLLARGVPAVLAMQAPVSDSYATELSARLYETLAASASPEPLAALAEARRKTEQERLEGRLAATTDLAEWPTAALYLRAAPLPLYDEEAPFEEIETVPEPRLAEGIVVRPVGDFVGRRREKRLAWEALRDKQCSGILLRGLGGVGKSSLAAEVVRWSLEEGWKVGSVKGETSPDAVLAEIGRCVRAAAGEGRAGERRRDLAVELQRPDRDWEERFDLLSRQLLGEAPLLLLLDNFEDNLAGGGPADAALPARLKNADLEELLVRWLLNPGDSRLVFTCRFRFQLPRQAHRRLRELHLGPLSFAEARKLMWRLPGLDDLEPRERLRAYADVGGHPRALEYLDALLRGGQARSPDVAERMEAVLAARGLAEAQGSIRYMGGDLDHSTAEAVSLASGDVLLDGLLDRLAEVPLASQLLLGASVYREPVDVVGLAWQVSEVQNVPPDPEREERIRKVTAAIERARDQGQEATSAALGLSAAEVAEVQEDLAAARRPPLTIPPAFEGARAAIESLGLLAPMNLGASPEGLCGVHRWTASAVARRGSAEDLQRAHGKAAAYWEWRVKCIPQSREQDLEQLLEARYHYCQARDIEASVVATSRACSWLHDWGAYRREEQLCFETVGWVPEHSEEAAAFIHQLGLISQGRGDYEQALSFYWKALGIDKELGNRAGMASSYHQLGSVARERGDYDQALSWYQKSLQIEEELGNLAGIAGSYHQLGWVAEERGDYDQALSWYQKALGINEERGTRAGMAASYHHLGMVAQKRGNYDQALSWYQEALHINEELGDRARMATSYHQLGMVAQNLGNYDRALSWYQQSLQINEELGNRAGMAASYHQVGIVAQERGDYDEALSWYQKSLHIKEELGNRAGVATSYHQLGMVAQKRGDYDQALSWYQKSFRINEELGNRAGMAAIYHQLGMVAQERGDCDQASSWYQTSLRINEELVNRFGIAVTTSQMGAMLTTTGSPEKALPLNLRSLVICLEIRSPHVRTDLYWLARQRTTLGEERFRTLLREHVGDEGSSKVVGMLDSAAGREGGTDMGGAPATADQP